jgi:hypothetical protein
MQPRILATLMGALLASGALMAQSACFDTSVGTNLNLGDDDVTSALPLGFTFTYGGVGYTDICVCSNGYIWLGATSVIGGDFSPTQAELLSGAPRICPFWVDFNPTIAGSGQIYFNAVAASGSNPAYALVTWAGVYEFGTTNPLSVQIKLDANNGINVTYGADTANATGGTFSPGTVIIGASPGNNAAANPVSFATRPFTITSDTFAEVIAVPSFPYAGASMLLVPTVTPGYAVVDTPCIPNASWTVIGGGCPLPTTTSAYELFDTTNNLIDLSNRSFQFLPNGVGGYLAVQPAAGPWFAGFTNSIGAGDDTIGVVNLPYPFPYAGGYLNAIAVSSNGFIWLDPTNTNAACCSGDTYDMLNDSPRIAGLWMDLNANTGGAVYADLDATTGEFVVTWAGISEYSVPGSANTFQIALSPSGAFEIRYQTVGISSIYHAAIAGYSGGLGAVDSQIDLSTTTVFDSGTAATPLGLNPPPNVTPQLNTTFPMTLSAIPNTSALSLFVLGFNNTGTPLDLTSFGAPGCNGYVNVFTGFSISILQLTGGAPSVTLNLPIPGTVSLAGLTMYAQGVADTTSNSLGLLFSNGGKIFVGL